MGTVYKKCFSMFFGGLKCHIRWGCPRSGSREPTERCTAVPGCNSAVRSEPTRVIAPRKSVINIVKLSFIWVIICIYITYTQCIYNIFTVYIYEYVVYKQLLTGILISAPLTLRSNVAMPHTMLL